MPKLNWFFSENPKGTKQGYSDAGLETFRRSPYASIARESIQNSLDAHDGTKKPVIVRFEVKQVSIKSIPGIDELYQAMLDCQRMWKSNKKAAKFFRGAIKLLKQDQLPILIVSDRNTKGLAGRDDEEGQPWDSLIRSIGASSKNEGEGGSFGIGSSAPFAASGLRTVFYSTRTSKAETAFIGRARLTTHETKDGKRFDPNGYLGLNEGERVEDPKKVPPFMRRDENGTTLAILGFGLHENAKDELAKAVLEHFWPAIHFGDLEVEFGKSSIKQANLGDLLQKYAVDDKNFDAPEFYRCITEQGSEDFHLFQEDLPHLGPVDLYLRTAVGSLPKRVAMIRKTGMVIKLRRFNAPIDYCGAFICRNDKGNHKLRDMEPPEHNEWSPNLPEHGASRKIDIEIADFVRSKIKELLEVDESKPLEVEGLGRYLPEFDEDGKANETGGEGDTMPENANIPTSPIGSKPPKRTSDELGDLGPTEGPNDGPNSDPQENDETGGNSQSSGQPPGDRKEAEVEISQRCFSTGKLGRKYTVNVRPTDKSRHTVDLAVRIVGEDGVENLEIAAATLDGKSLDVHEPNIIRDVKLAATKSTAIEIELETPQRVALEVVAHED
ncbi:MAG: hypothetical protein WD049_10050 [Candidatus Paceibacterota bacterium]